MNRYSLYWKLSYNCTHANLLSVASPILIEKGSRCDYVLTRWNKLLDIKAFRIFGAICFVNEKNAIQQQHQDPLEHGYFPFWVDRKVEEELKNPPPHLLVRQKEEEWRNYLYSVESTEEDWDKEEAERLKHDQFVRKCGREMFIKELKYLPFYFFSSGVRWRVHYTLRIIGYTPLEFFKRWKLGRIVNSVYKKDRENWRWRKCEYLKRQEAQRNAEISAYYQLRQEAERGEFPSYLLCN